MSPIFSPKATEARHDRKNKKKKQSSYLLPAGSTATSIVRWPGSSKKNPSPVLQSHIACSSAPLSSRRRFCLTSPLTAAKNTRLQLRLTPFCPLDPLQDCLCPAPSLSLSLSRPSLVPFHLFLLSSILPSWFPSSLLLFFCFPFPDAVAPTPARCRWCWGLLPNPGKPYHTTTTPNGYPRVYLYIYMQLL